MAERRSGVDVADAPDEVLVGVRRREVRALPKLLPRRRCRLASQVTTEAVFEMLSLRRPGQGVPGAAR